MKQAKKQAYSIFQMFLDSIAIDKANTTHSERLEAQKQALEFVKKIEVEINNI